MVSTYFKNWNSGFPQYHKTIGKEVGMFHTKYLDRSWQADMEVLVVHPYTVRVYRNLLSLANVYLL
jgi:hypothetical protein